MTTELLQLIVVIGIPVLFAWGYALHSIYKITKDNKELVQLNGAWDELNIEWQELEREKQQLVDEYKILVEFVSAYNIKAKELGLPEFDLNYNSKPVH